MCITCGVAGCRVDVFQRQQLHGRTRADRALKNIGVEVTQVAAVAAGALREHDHGITLLNRVGCAVHHEACGAR